MNKKFLIKSWGRCGSTFVQYWLSRHNNCMILYEENDQLSKETKRIIKHTTNNISISSHSLFWLPKDIENWYFIHIKRRQKFNQVISSIVQEYTGQHTRYNKSKFDAVYVNYKKIKHNLKNLKFYDNNFEAIQLQYSWRNTYTLYYEDFINNDDYLNFLKISSTEKSFYQPPKESQKNPRDNSKLIINYEALKDYYEKKLNHVYE